MFIGVGIPQSFVTFIAAAGGADSEFILLLDPETGETLVDENGQFLTDPSAAWLFDAEVNNYLADPETGIILSDLSAFLLSDPETTSLFTDPETGQFLEDA